MALARGHEGQRVSWLPESHEQAQPRGPRVNSFDASLGDPGKRAGNRHYKDAARKVSHSRICPLSKPRRNHRTRWAAEP